MLSKQHACRQRAGGSSGRFVWQRSRPNHIVSALQQGQPGASAANASGAGASAEAGGVRQRLALLAPSLRGNTSATERSAAVSTASAATAASAPPSAPSLRGNGSATERSAAVSTASAATAAPAPPSAPLPSTDAESGTVLTFAYGANMHQQTLIRRGVTPLSRDGAFIVDPSVRMRFIHRGGYATLDKISDDSSSGSNGSGSSAVRFPPFVPNVHGVLYRVAAADMDKLKKAEGGYALKEFEVETYDGRRALAKAFVSGPLAALPAEVVPTEKYMRALREAAADQFLDPGHQMWLSGIPTVCSEGLGADYFNSPSKYIAYGFLGIVGLMILGFFTQH